MGWPIRWEGTAAARVRGVVEKWALRGRRRRGRRRRGARRVGRVRRVRRVRARVERGFGTIVVVWG